MTLIDSTIGCPFCGSWNLSYTTPAHPHGNTALADCHIYCCTCGATGPDATSWEEAMKLWKKRSPSK